MIYVFYLDGIPKNGAGNMHGGNAYSKRMIRKLTEAGLKISILIPKMYKPIDFEEKEIFENKNVTVIEREALDSGMKLEDNSILFFPLLRGKNMGILESFKKKNKNLEIYITIHGLRLLDLKPDPYDRYYTSGILYRLYNLVSPGIYLIKSNIYRKTMAQKLQFADKVFTVSNYSLKQITSCAHPKYIKPYYCGINLDVKKAGESKDRKRYFLFVSAKRSEKNFLRTLEAFIRYAKEEQGEDYSLYVTGLDQGMVKKLRRYRGWDSSVIKQRVKIFDYIDAEQLAELYQNASVILYTSKSEGFGLPALEACFSGIPLIAPYGSAVPEVLESSAYYIDPHSVDSICEGIKAMADTKIQEDYRKRMLRYEQVARKRIELSDENFVKEFSQTK